MSSKSPRKSDKQPAGPQPAPSTEKTAAPKPKPKPRQERTKGKTVLPTEQIQMIVQERGHVNITSKEAVFVLSAATEEFIRILIRASQQQAIIAKHQLIALRDIACIVHEQSRLKFLEETIPRTVSIVEAMRMRDKFQNGDVKENGDAKPPAQALSASMPPPEAGPSSTRRSESPFERDPWYDWPFLSD